MSFTLLDERFVKATRKQYRCIWCPEPIEKGSSCISEASLYDGEFQSNRFHPECCEAMRNTAYDAGDDIIWDPHEHKRGTGEPR